MQLKLILCAFKSGLKEGRYRKLWFVSGVYRLCQGFYAWASFLVHFCWFTTLNMSSSLLNLFLLDARFVVNLTVALTVNL